MIEELHVKKLKDLVKKCSSKSNCKSTKSHKTRKAARRSGITSDLLKVSKNEKVKSWQRWLMIYLKKNKRGEGATIIPIYKRKGDVRSYKITEVLSFWKPARKIKI